MDSSRIIEHLEFLIEFSEATIPKSRKIIIEATQEQIKTLVECIINTPSNKKVPKEVLEAASLLKPYFYRKKNINSSDVKQNLSSCIRQLKVIVTSILQHLTEQSVLTTLLES